MTEDELIEACLRNSPRAQKALFEAYSPRLMGLCLRYAKNSDEAQDMLQEGFIKIFQKLDTYSGEGAFGGWMHRLMINTCLDYLRKTSRLGFSVELEKADLKINEAADTISKMRVQELLKLIQSLPDGYRVVFNMFAIEGYGHKEIAKHLGVTESTSKSQYRKAKLWLQRAIEKQERIMNG